MSLTFLAAVALLQADDATAQRCIAESLEIGRALRDRRAAWSLDVLACLTTRQANLERALQLAGAGSAMHEASGNTPPAAVGGLCLTARPARAERRGSGRGPSEVGGWRAMAFDEALEFALAGVSAPWELPPAGEADRRQEFRRVA